VVYMPFFNVPMLNGHGSFSISMNSTWFYYSILYRSFGVKYNIQNHRVNKNGHWKHIIIDRGGRINYTKYFDL